MIKNLKELQKDPDFDFDVINKVSNAAGKLAIFLSSVIEIYEKL